MEHTKVRSASMKATTDHYNNDTFAWACANR